MGCMIFELCYIMLEVIGTVGIMRKLYSGHVGIFMLTWWSILFFFLVGNVLVIIAVMYGVLLGHISCI